MYIHISRRPSKTYPACGMANSAQGCIAPCLFFPIPWLAQSREPMEAFDLDQLERIREQLAEQEVPEAPPPIRRL